MAAPVYATDLTDFYLDGAATVTALGGGASGLGNPETDFYIQGASCISKQAWTNATKGFNIDGLGTTFTVPTDGCVIAFAVYTATGSLDSKANGGLQLLIGSAATSFQAYYVGGSDTLAYDSWVPYVVDPNTATADASAGTTSWRYVGTQAKLPTTAGPTKGNPLALDVVRYGRGRIDYTLGDLANGYNTFSGCEAYANATTRRWGLIEFIRGAYVIQGFHQLGTSGAAVDFRDANKVLFWRACANNNANDAVSTGFNRIEIANASTNVDWDNLIFQALGTRARGVLVHTAGSFDATNCQFVDMDTFALLAASAMTGCVFRRTNAITCPGSDLRDSQVLTPTVAADSAGLQWTAGNTVDTDGKLDGMTFSKGTNAHHAIQFGATTKQTITLRDITFTGFNASDAANDSVLLFPDTGSNVAWTVNAVACSGTVSYKKTRSGDTVTVIADPVTLAVHVQDTVTGAALSGARVYVTAAAGGSLSAGTVIINGTTDGSGDISDTRTYASDQPITGWVRLAPTTGPWYKTGPVAGSVDSVAGLSTTIQMIPDA